MRAEKPAARALLLFALCLGGCYADLDWRKLASEEGRFQVLMPARSQSESRSIGKGATMTLWTTSARDTLFGVSYSDYPDAASLHVPEARDALVRNVSGSLIDDRPDAAAPRGARPASGLGESRRLTISGSAGGTGGSAKDAAQAVRIHAYFHAIDRRLYQLTVITRPGVLSESDLEMFFSSFELR